jgi:hypothetical protein
MKNVLTRIMVAVAFVASLPLFAAVPNADTTFEFYNKDSETVRITDFSVAGGSIVKKDFASNTLIAPSRGSTISAVRAQIRVEDANNLLIYLQVFVPGRGDYKYTITPGHKTVFVSFTSSKTPSLYPQTGPLKGLLGKTETGLPLKNNLSSSDIRQGDFRSTWQKIIN